MNEILAVANSPVVWLLCLVTVGIAFLQTVLYTHVAVKIADRSDIELATTKKAFKVGLVSAIGPAVGVFIVMVGLMNSIGAPVAWLRLSIIGSAGTELAAATCGATACGVTLGGDDYTLMALAVGWFTMALNGAGWLLFTGFFTPKLETIRRKVSGGDAKWLVALSGAASLGIYGYLNHQQILKSYGNAIASITGALTMVFVVKVLSPKFPRLLEYSLGIAMVTGMASAVVYDIATGL